MLANSHYQSTGFRCSPWHLRCRHLGQAGEESIRQHPVPLAQHALFPTDTLLRVSIPPSPNSAPEQDAMVQPCCLVSPCPQMMSAPSCFSISASTRARDMEVAGTRDGVPSVDPSVWWGHHNSSRDTQLQETWVIPVHYPTSVPWGKDWAWGAWDEFQVLWSLS